ncbi:glycosyltransferase family 4 protein [Patescibacteria group bacterium]|nr:glycosyltransferase family 4 protein [Patescibacteria group bacterium]MBU1123894.1 glycosyltransferase family 4 protein [Patescibacteria group bacterium]MBU1911473.1 glycosyltransferase family 4 protein [Patescibacteria group bacterium]
MKIVLATGIYPPDIGGPATYVCALANELSRREMEVIVVTYCHSPTLPECQKHEGGSLVTSHSSDAVEIVKVKFGRCPICRWFRYARALKKVGKDADIIYAFSSVSCGVPLKFARLKKPKKILRLGGDFVWERYTAVGGRRSLREWYGRRSFVYSFTRLLVYSLLKSFDHIVFSTRFQEEIYEGAFKRLPPHCVIENAMPMGMSEIHVARHPFSILFMGRFVGFKNLPNLLKAIKKIPEIRLTLVGDGPKKEKLSKLVSNLKLRDRVMFAAPVHGEEKRKVFEGHDLLVIPSITEISPNIALEARSCGLPVLLTKETGLSENLRKGMVIRDLKSVDSIVNSIEEIRNNYQDFALEASDRAERRGWGEVAAESLRLFEDGKRSN